MRLCQAIVRPFLVAGSLCADEPRSTPLPVPLTRPEMKQYLEHLKQRTPRIPLPPLTDEEKEKLGDRAKGYESRVRYHYMGGSGAGRGGGGGGGFFGEKDPNMSLDYIFKTKLFWIVSRTNNCQY